MSETSLCYGTEISVVLWALRYFITRDGPLWRLFENMVMQTVDVAEMSAALSTKRKTFTENKCIAVVTHVRQTATEQKKELANIIPHELRF
jgi:hypothetical protein